LTHAPSPPVVIIGAGLAGLACAIGLQRRGIGCAVLEATDRVGGRVRSDVVDGFTLDHGFQVLLTAYPACRELLDYPKLRLQPFEPGALIRHRGGFVTLGDPWRRPSQALATALSPVGTLGDKLRIARLRWSASRGTLDELFERPEEPTIERLRRLGFTEPFIDQFFRPFLGGVYLDPELQTTSRMLEFVFRMFAAGDIALPADGMAAIPRQLAERLPRGTLRLRQSVEAIEDGRIYLTGGEVIQPERIVVATESDSAAALVGDPQIATRWNHTVNHYFAADASPDRRKLLILAGDEYSGHEAAGHEAARDHQAAGNHATGPIGTVVVLSDIAPQYAPPGQALISVSTTRAAGWDVSGSGLGEVRDQLVRWFGPAATTWQHLRSYSVPYALPVVTPESIPPRPRERGEIVLCGDYLETPSIQGALVSGMRAAELVAARS
jgi:phytoene dehydrogenase-like protein